MAEHGTAAVSVTTSIAPADNKLLTALACGVTIEQAARSAAISESSAYRRLREPEFRQRLDDVRADMAQRTASMLTAAAMQAVKTLLALQQAPVLAAARLGAARPILGLGIRFRETAELAQWHDPSIEELKIGPGSHLQVLTDANWFGGASAGETPPDPQSGPARLGLKARVKRRGKTLNAALLVRDLPGEGHSRTQGIFEAWREGAHDDLVFAAAMAAWLGELTLPPLVDLPKKTWFTASWRCHDGQKLQDGSELAWPPDRAIPTPPERPSREPEPSPFRCIETG